MKNKIDTKEEHDSKKTTVVGCIRLSIRLYAICSEFWGLIVMFENEKVIRVYYFLFWQSKYDG